MKITPSQIIEYLYCPRFTYFEYVLRIPQKEDKHFKVVKGRQVHELQSETNKKYLRKKIGVQEKFLNRYLSNDVLAGEVDEVLVLNDGTMAPLDYKFAIYKDRVYDTYKTQLYCYAWLIESNYDKNVKKGFLVYTRSNNKLIEVTINQVDKQKIKQGVDEITQIMVYNYFPRATKYKKRCIGCTYKNVCVQ